MNSPDQPELSREDCTIFRENVFGGLECFDQHTILLVLPAGSAASTDFGHHDRLSLDDVMRNYLWGGYEVGVVGLTSLGHGPWLAGTYAA